MKQSLRKPLYWGSKSPYSVLGKWIISMIPWEFETTYVEPFAGMLGILLGRRPVRSEIVNDLDNNLYNWWCVVRDESEALARLISATPHSRRGLIEAYRIVDNPEGHSPLRRAHALHVVLEQGIYRRMDSEPSWRVAVNPVGARRDLLWTGSEIYPLACRFKDVQIENRDALKVLERVCAEPAAVIYCDPPYPTADTSPYRKREFDIARMSEILMDNSNKARVAISGYGSEWDNLGWVKSENNISTSQIQGLANVKKATRTEVLWTNYPPPNQQVTFDL